MATVAETLKTRREDAAEELVDAMAGSPEAAITLLWRMYGRFPELAGTKEAAKILCVERSNVRAKKGLPSPVATLGCSKIYMAADIRRLARRPLRRVV